jgi:hypothetical protein
VIRTEKLFQKNQLGLKTIHNAICLRIMGFICSEQKEGLTA